jgi:phosphoribosylaminoimidazolecarboxamide formyltransferase/IMP cyclohydrolase
MIGGVTLLRAAAKNYSKVTIITDPADYATIIDQIESNENLAEKNYMRDIISDEHRRRLAFKVGSPSIGMG